MLCGAPGAETELHTRLDSRQRRFGGPPPQFVHIDRRQNLAPAIKTDLTSKDARGTGRDAALPTIAAIPEICSDLRLSPARL